MEGQKSPIAADNNIINIEMMLPSPSASAGVEEPEVVEDKTAAQPSEAHTHVWDVTNRGSMAALGNFTRKGD